MRFVVTGVQPLAEEPAADAKHSHYLPQREEWGKLEGQIEQHPAKRDQHWVGCAPCPSGLLWMRMALCGSAFCLGRLCLVWTVRLSMLCCSVLPQRAFLPALLLVPSMSLCFHSKLALKPDRILAHAAISAARRSCSATGQPTPPWPPKSSSVQSTTPSTPQRSRRRMAGKGMRWWRRGGVCMMAACSSNRQSSRECQTN